MNILIVVEVDWIKKVTYEMHHLSELFSLSRHNVFAVDIPDPGFISLSKQNYKTIKNYHRVYDKATVTLFRTPTIPIKGLHRISAYFVSHGFIKKILKKNKIDIVILFAAVNNSLATVKACRDLKVPLIHRTFDIPHDLIREDFLRNIVSKIERSEYPRFDKVIANTPYMKNWAEEMGAPNVDVIPQGVDPNIMKPLLQDENLQKKLRINKKDRIIMYLGSIESFSGLEVLIDNIPYILKEIPDLKLLIVGGGSFLEPLKKQVSKLGISQNIIFTGFVPYLEIPKYCSLAELCVNTFRITDMTNKLSPVKVFDLQACGKPVLSTPLQGLINDFPEEKCGITYSILEEFPKKIISLLGNKDRLIAKGNLGREFIGQNYTWNKAAERWIAELQKFVTV